MRSQEISKDDLHRAEMVSIQKAKNLTWDRGYREST